MPRGRWLFAVAAVWAETPPGMETTLTAMLFSGGRAALAHVATPVRSGSARSPRTTRPATSSPTPLLALVLERHLDGRPDRPAGIGLRDLRAGDRYLLCPDGLSPVAEDRPHFNVLTLRDISADAPASWPP